MSTSSPCFSKILASRVTKRIAWEPETELWITENFSSASAGATVTAPRRLRARARRRNLFLDLRRIARVALDVLDDVHVPIGLHARGDRPHHLALVEDVDVCIDHDDVLDEVAGPEGRQGRLLRLAVDLLVDGDVAIEAAAPGEREVNRPDRRDHTPDHVEEASLLRDAADDPVVAVSDEDA